MSGLRAVVAGLRFAEGPRWHDSALWYSDMHAGEVRRWVAATGVDELVLEIEGQTSGLGWDPQGRLLVVSMIDRRLLRQEGDGSVTEVADLSGLATFHCNDMVVDAAGRAYIGNFGHEVSVIVDYPFVTGRSNHDSYPTGQKMVEVLDNGLRQWGFHPTGV